MSITAQLTDRETQLAADMAGVLDLLSRVMDSLDRGNLHYASQKAEGLIERAETLAEHLHTAFEHIGKEPAPRPEKLKAAISEYSRFYRAGKALYPVDAKAGGR